MRLTPLVVLASSLAAVACSSSTSARTVAQSGEWASDQADLIVGNASAHLSLLANTGCVSSYGDIAGRIPLGAFDLDGTYSVLTALPSGPVVYAARFSGTVQGSTMSLTVTVPDLQQTLGPFTLTYGVHQSFTQCALPDVTAPATLAP